MSEEVHETTMKRIQEEDFIKRSEQAKKNKRGGSLDNVSEPGFFQGSISASDHARREGTSARERERASWFQGKTNYGCIWRKLTEYKEKGIEIDPNAVYLEVVGGRKRALILGLGTAGDLLYEKSSSRSDKSSTYTPSILSPLSQCVEQQAQEIESQRLQLEKQRLDMEAQSLQHEQERLRVEKEKLEETRKMNDYLAEMKMTVQEYRDASCRGPFDSPHSHDPRDLSGGGSAMC
ncbi:Myb/SANT-like DNA-binding domain-containing protein 4 [Bienertia sinuspersici]